MFASELYSQFFARHLKHFFQIVRDQKIKEFMVERNLLSIRKFGALGNQMGTIHIY
jgi:hypothetical protein